MAKPAIVLKGIVLVEIATASDSADPQRVAPDDGEIQDFLAWQRTSGIYPVQGLLSSPGVYRALFSADDRGAIETKLAQLRSRAPNPPNP